MTNTVNHPSKVTVHFVPDDMDVQAPAGTRLLDIATTSGADLTFGCKKGTCGTCRVRITEGLKNLSPCAREEQDFLASLGSPNTERLACQVRVLGNVSVDYPK